MVKVDIWSDLHPLPLGLRWLNLLLLSLDSDGDTSVKKVSFRVPRVLVVKTDWGVSQLFIEKCPAGPIWRALESDAQVHWSCPYASVWHQWQAPVSQVHIISLSVMWQI